MLNLIAPKPQSDQATAQVADARLALTVPRVGLFSAMLLQLLLVIGVTWFFLLEEPAFFVMLWLVLIGFSIHYWLPFRHKELFFVAFSLGGAYVLLHPLVATTAIGVGCFVYVLLTSGLSFRAKLLTVLALTGVAAYLRSGSTAVLGLGVADLGLPDQIWPIVGSIFMFRLIVYMYDLRHATERPSAVEFFSYFFMLPNYYFVLFPVVDFQTMRKSYFRRDINAIAQEGLSWIVRGVIQLLLYRLIYNYRSVWSPEYITTFPQLVREMILIYLLYLRVSGTFHIIIGIMHLFGYDLPETHRRYLFAGSLTDFWRRINIYWKDFMVKLVYFPVYFRLRRSGERRAQIIATSIVFVATWFLHSYQFFWLSGTFLLTGPDIAFWAILGSLVVVNMLVEQNRPRRLVRQDTWRARLRQILGVIGTLILILILWSLWHSESIGEFIETVSWWALRPR